jgi:DNA-binding CsgD family transcriptional regulator
MALLDEALAGAAGHDVHDVFILSDVFCQMFVACERAHDVERADQWIRVGESIAERRNLPVVSAFCQTHYGGLLTAAGRWTEADAALTEAVRLWNLGFRPLRHDAQIRLAALRVKQGRIEEAGALLDGVEVDAESALPLAAVHRANGDLGLARDVLERAVDEIGDESSTAGPLLAGLVDVHVAAGAPDLAATAVERLVVCAELHPSPYLTALAASARVRAGTAASRDDARSCLRVAISEFAKAQMPMELALARLQLAEVLADTDPEVARAEARAALDVFTRLDAPRLVDAAAAVMRRLGVRAVAARRSDGVLTKREAEVLELLGAGLSNPQIAARLYISRKTVEHHVGNILAKLGLRSRAEAAVYAARENKPPNR